MMLKHFSSKVYLSGFGNELFIFETKLRQFSNKIDTDYRHGREILSRIGHIDYEVIIYLA